MQGPTSSGKTTLVSYLAAKTGHHCIRINNHEGTDLQEYIGSYITDEQGRLSFREGALVTALRKGHWIVLDELNLAPSEVLEALNRFVPQFFSPSISNIFHELIATFKQQPMILVFLGKEQEDPTSSCIDQSSGSHQIRSKV